MGIVEKVRGLKSNQTRPLQPPREPTAFEVVGGFGPAGAAAGAGLDPEDDERTARREGAAVAIELERQRVERLKAQRDAQPQGGRDYSKGLGG